MTIFITKGQAACLLLGEPVTDDNRVKCKKIVEETPFEVVYTLERGNTKPIAIGKAVAQRDPFSYIEYPNTPPRQDTKPGKIEAENIVIQPSESSSSTKSSSSSQSIKPTKASVLDLLRGLITINPSSCSKSHYTFETLAEKDIFSLVIKHMPNAEATITAKQMTNWIKNDGSFGKSNSMRQGYNVIKARNVWVLKPEFVGDQLRKIFNRKSFRESVRLSVDWITIDYCRKSPSKEKQERRLELLQKMVHNLRVNDLCEKVFVSPVCRADSDLLIRDKSSTLTANNLMGKLRFQDGDFQDLLMFATTSTLSVRLVVLDYAGLSTNPSNIRKFIRKTKAIKQVVIDHGHKLESFDRAELMRTNIISKFDCRKAPVKRSSLE